MLTMELVIHLLLRDDDLTAFNYNPDANTDDGSFTL